MIILSLFDELKDLIIINGQLEVSPDSIHEDTDLVENLAYNSIALILLMIAIEEKWEIDMESDEIESSSLSNVGYLLNVISKYTN